MDVLQLHDTVAEFAALAATEFARNIAQMSIFVDETSLRIERDCLIHTIESISGWKLRHPSDRVRDRSRQMPSSCRLCWTVAISGGLNAGLRKILWQQCESFYAAGKRLIEVEAALCG